MVLHYFRKHLRNIRSKVSARKLVHTDSFSSDNHDFVLRFHKVVNKMNDKVNDIEVDVEVEETTAKKTKKKTKANKVEDTATVQDGTKIQITADRTSYTYTFPNPAMSKAGGYYIGLDKVSVSKQAEEFQTLDDMTRITLRVNGSESSATIESKYFDAFSTMVNNNFGTMATAVNQMRSGNISGAAKTVGRSIARKKGGCKTCGGRK